MVMLMLAEQRLLRLCYRMPPLRGFPLWSSTCTELTWAEAITYNDGY